MVRNIYMRIVEYKTDCGRHIVGLCRREESLGTFCRGMGHDTVKFIKFFGKPHSSKNHKEAVRFVKKGTAEYNKGRFDQAIYYFQRAVHEDKEYARAYYYLGNALAKKERKSEAISAWAAAAEVNPRSDIARLAEGRLDRMKVDRDTIVGMHR